MPARFNPMRFFAVTCLVAIIGLVVNLVHFQAGVSATIESIKDEASWVAFLALLSGIFFLVLKRAQTEIERQAKALKACRQALAQAERRALPGRMLTGLAHHLATPLAFTKSNVFMSIQALDDMAPAIRAASRLLDTVGAGDVSVPHALDVDPESVRPLLNRCPDEILVTQDMLTDVLMALDQMEQLVNSLRLFTRLERPGDEALNLNAVLHSVVSLARAVLPSNVKVVESGPELPPVDCDVAQLSHTFLSLILHAAQGIDGAGAITVTTSTGAQHIRVRIEDTGGGLADGALHPIDPDFSARPSDAGPGPGLSFVRDIVCECGGRISVESRPGVGTAVQVELPMKTRASP